MESRHLVVIYTGLDTVSTFSGCYHVILPLLVSTSVAWYISQNKPLFLYRFLSSFVDLLSFIFSLADYCSHCVCFPLWAPLSGS